MDRDSFFNELRQSGLLSGQALEEAAARFADAVRGEAISRVLVADGLLTRFQAKKLLAGQGRTLHLGPYRILDRLGRGATGSVFKAMHRTMGRVVAIKLVHPQVLEDSTALGLFRREVRAVAQLHHPGIATAYDAGVARGRHFLVMEYVDGPSLQRLVQRQGPLPATLACALMQQAAAALQYAHEQGMVHRDIKPANLLIANLPAWERAEGKGGPPRAAPSPLPFAPQAAGSSRAPLVKIIDFGLARLRRTGIAGMESTIKVVPGTVWGTIDYLAPEQAQDIHAADICSDLYSLGCTFYYALTGQPPFPGASDLEKLVKHQLCDALPLTELRPDIPAALAAIIHRLMNKERGQRFQTPAQLARELAGVYHTPVGGAGTVEIPDEVCWGQHAQGANQPGSDPVVADPVVRAQETVAQVLRLPSPALPLAPAFLEDWQQWTAIVESFASGHGSGHRVEPQSYYLLHRRLVEACKTQAGQAEGVRREFLLSLAELVKPWLNPDILQRTDRELLYSLLWLCQRAEQGLMKIAASPAATLGGESQAMSEGGQTLLGAILKLFKKWRERQQ